MKFRVPGLYRRPQIRPGDNAIPIRGLHGEMPVRFAESGAVPGERIVYVYEMRLDGVKISALLATVEFKPAEAGAVRKQMDKLLEDAKQQLMDESK